MPSEMNIPQHLYQWFQEFDELIIPDLGRFEADYQNASLQPSIHKILPPNKEIYFDAAVKSNDTKFAFYVANKENSTLENAQAHIQHFVKTLKAELGIRKEYQVGVFGKFIYTPQGQIDFQQNEETIYAGSSFGLPELYNLKPTQGQTESKGNTSPDYLVPEANEENIEEESRQETQNNQEMEEYPEDEIIVEEEYIESSSRKWVTAAVVVLLVVIVGAIISLLAGLDPINTLMGIKQNNANSSETSLLEDDPLERDEILDANRSLGDEDNKTEKPKDTQNDNLGVGEVQDPEIDYPVDKGFVNGFTYNPNPPANLQNHMITKPNAQSKYYVILGSFGNKSNAYSYLNNLLAKGISSAKIIAPGDKNNTYRIVYQEYASLQEAVQQGKEFCKQNKLIYFVLKY